MYMRKGKKNLNLETIAKQTEEYLASCIDVETQRIKSYNPSNGATTYELAEEVRLPTIEGLAEYLNIPNRSLYELSEIHEEVAQALERVMEKQKERLTIKGLSGKYNSTIAKLMLSHNHGMSERTESNHNVNVSGIDIIVQDE